jgi:aspartyl-tRNA synthetase
VLHGYIGTRRDASKNLTFVELHDMTLGATVQLVSTPTKGIDGSDSPHVTLRALQEHSPVAINGTIKARKAPSGKDGEARAGLITSIEVKIDNITPLNSFPNDIIMSKDTVFPPEQRHLQIRNDPAVRNALAFRSKAARIVRNELCLSPRRKARESFWSLHVLQA